MREFDEGTVRRLPLFADIGDAALELVMGSARRLEVGAGETVVRRWQGTRHFYIVVAGGIEIRGETKGGSWGNTAGWVLRRAGRARLGRGLWLRTHR